jgi:hypothetical protein
MNIEPRDYVNLDFNSTQAKDGIVICGYELTSYKKPKSNQNTILNMFGRVKTYDISVLCFNPTVVISELKEELKELEISDTIYSLEDINSIREIFIKKTNQYIFKPTLQIETLSEFLKVSKFKDVSRQGYVKFKHSTLWQKKDLKTVIKNKANIYTYVMANNKMEYITPDSELVTNHFMYRVALEYNFDKILQDIFTKDYLYKKFKERKLKKTEHILLMSIDGKPAGYQLLDLTKGELIDPGYETLDRSSLSAAKAQNNITKIIAINSSKINIIAIDELMAIIFREPHIFKTFCYNIFINIRTDVNTSNIFIDNSFICTQFGTNMSGVAVLIINSLIEYLGDMFVDSIDMVEFQFQPTKSRKNMIMIDRTRDDIYNTNTDVALENWKLKYSTLFRYDDNFLKSSILKSNTFLFYFLLSLNSQN